MYASGWGTRGILTPGQQDQIGATPKKRELLIAAGLWDDLKEGSIGIHDWDEHNDKRDDKRERDRERMREKRRQEREQSRDIPATVARQSRDKSDDRPGVKSEGSEGSEGKALGLFNSPAGDSTVADMIERSLKAVG